jgi:hypothetical protein
MTDREPDRIDKSGDLPADDPQATRRGVTLETLVTVTDEMEHLNELVLLHVERSGGFTCTESYFAIVTPVLDMLEKEIRFRYYDGISQEQLKLVIQDWIDKEITLLKRP